MRDVALEIVRGIFSDVSGRKGMTDDIDDEVLGDIFRSWYSIAARAINPGCSGEAPADLRQRVLEER
jgi:hypothetical protein